MSKQGAVPSQYINETIVAYLFGGRLLDNDDCFLTSY